MNTTSVPDLDILGRPITMSQSIDPMSMTFLHHGQTQAQVVRALYQVIYSPESERNRIWLLSSEFECIMTYLLCFFLIGKKKSLGKFWMFAKRRTPFGTIFVANAVFVLSIGVTAYLIIWDMTALVIASFSFANRSTFEWWWVIPFPWLPLVLAVFVSNHGFMLACSPRSPLAPGGSSGASRKRRIFLPISKRPAFLNMTLILPCALFIFSTFYLCAMSGKAFFHARSLSSQIIPADIMALVNKSAKQKKPPMFDGQDLLASDELIWAARRACAAYFDCHRYVSINLTVFAGAAFSIEVPIVLYGIPNLVSLVDHACSLHPDFPGIRGFFRKSYWLITKGKPTSDDSKTHLNIGTWKMTILALGFIGMLGTIVPTFGFIPIFLVMRSFPHEILRGDISPSIRVATIAVSIITILSCTFIAGFCTVATLDPLFRAAIGLNMTRNGGPVEIAVAHHTTVDVAGPAPTETSNHGDLEALSDGRARFITLKPSASTLNGSLDEANSHIEEKLHVSRDDIELGSLSPTSTSPTRSVSFKRASP